MSIRFARTEVHGRCKPLGIHQIEIATMHRNEIGMQHLARREDRYRWLAVPDATLALKSADLPFGTVKGSQTEC